MKYVLATVQVPDQERHYYCGPIRKGLTREALRVTNNRAEALKFSTREEAEAMLRELDAAYEVLDIDAP